MKSLKCIFEPKSIAVIGASATAGTVGNAIFSNMLQSSFKGPVYPVNPRYNNIMSVKAYKNILSVPGAVDLAIVCVPRNVVENIIKE
jgi:acyl-CoA synthetase (NDP forming)